MIVENSITLEILVDREVTKTDKWNGWNVIQLIVQLDIAVDCRTLAVVYFVVGKESVRDLRQKLEITDT